MLLEQKKMRIVEDVQMEINMRSLVILVQREDKLMMMNHLQLDKLILKIVFSRIAKSDITERVLRLAKEYFQSNV